MEYLVVIEKGPSSFGAYVPDLPGLGVVGRSVSDVKRLVKEAIQLHLAGLQEDGLPIPEPAARSHMVPVPRPRTRRVTGRSRPQSPARHVTRSRVTLR
ncbi:MAG: type II toxin-antitoxin system HicB family antitoxin [Vicinamibacterales bacterium]